MNYQSRGGDFIMELVRGQVATSESVRKGHPDKLCDYISDSILDAYVAVDSEAHVACETLVTSGVIVIAGEVNSDSKIEHSEVVRKALSDTGYDPDQFKIEDYIHKQSSDINQGVRKENCEIGAGDQGTMYGYAVNETKEMLPAPLVIARKICQGLDELQNNEPDLGIKPDGKSQVSVKYNKRGLPVKLDSVVVSVQHSKFTNYKELVNRITSDILPKAVSRISTISDVVPRKIYINPTGQFIIGGPEGDTGLTGRKIMVDTYGGYGRHGGGAFSGKDATKVDRSGAYQARSLAKYLVASNICRECVVSLSYAIGVVEPTAVYVDTLGTSRLAYNDSVISQAVTEFINLSPKSIIDRFQLNQIMMKKTSQYGHFGYPEFPWEKSLLEYNQLVRYLLTEARR